MGYGWMTKSWLASPENHATQKERAKVTAAHVEAPKCEVSIPVACTCLKWPFAHIHAEQDRGHARQRFMRDLGRQFFFEE